MNKKNILRIESSDVAYSNLSNKVRIGWGPYMTVRHLDIMSEFINSEKLLELKKILVRHEPSNQGHFPSYLASRPLPASFLSKRPGPREDPYIRGKINTEDIDWFYGFTSLNQFERWHYDREELLILHMSGFHLVNYVVSDWIEGLRQTMFRGSTIVHRKETFPLFAL